MINKNKEKEIIAPLIIEEKEELKRLKTLVALSKNLLQITKESGTVIIIKDGLSNREWIFLYILGVFLSFKAGLRDKETVSLKELYKKTGIPTTTLSSPLKRLLDIKVIKRVSSGDYGIYHHDLLRTKKILINIDRSSNKKRI